MSEREVTLTVDAADVLPLIKQFLYSEREAFLRELVSNSLDALQRVDKTHRLSSDFQDDQQPLKVEIHVDAVNRRLIISDNGDGMSEEEVIRNINQIAYSGARKFVEENLNKKERMIGRFGVGFYSCFMVSERVEIDTWSWRPNAGGCHWVGEGGSKVKLSAPLRQTRGTTITCQLGKDADEFLATDRLVKIIRRYLDFAVYPILLDGSLSNVTMAPWHLSRADREALPHSKYFELFDRLNPGENQPINWFAVEVEIPVEMRGLLFVPKREDGQVGKLRLYSNRIFVCDHVDELLPKWLAFLDGALDSDDLPINVSRERFRVDQRVRQAGQFLTNKALENFTRVAKEQYKDYLEIWENHGLQLKRGFVETTMEGNSRLASKLEALLLFTSSRQSWTSLLRYQERQREGDRKTFLYLTDERNQAVHLELWRNRNREVLFCTHPLDLLVIEFLKKAHPDWDLMRVDEAKFELDASPSSSAQQSTSTTNVQHPDVHSDSLTDLMRRVTAGEVARISVVTLPSKEIPAVLQMGENGVEKELINKWTDQRHQEKPDRELLLNSDSPLIQRLIELTHQSGTNQVVTGLATQLWDHVRLNAGLLSEDELLRLARRNAEFLTLVAYELSSLSAKSTD